MSEKRRDMLRESGLIYVKIWKRKGSLERSSEMEKKSRRRESMESECYAFNPMSDSWHWPENVADLQCEQEEETMERKQRPKKKKRTHQKPPAAGEFVFSFNFSAAS